MKQLKDLPKRGVRVEEDFDFHHKTHTSSLSMLSAESDKAMVDSYGAAVQAFDNSLVKETKNSNTEKLKQADEDFDRLYVDSHAYARAISVHPVTTVAEQGKQLLAIFEKYKNITRMSYSEEYANAHHFLQDLEALGIETIEALHFLPWYEQLTLLNARFNVLRNAKDSEKSTRTTGLTKQCREAADEAYKVFAQRINALVIINGEEGYAEFIDLVNTYIAELQANIKARETRSTNKKEDPTEPDSPDTPDTPVTLEGETTTEQEA